MNTKKSDQASKPARKNPRLDSMMRDLTASLHSAITETAPDALEKDPEENFADLAFRFIQQLQARGLMISALPTAEERIDRAMAKGAANALSTFTNWMRNNPGCSYDTRMSASGKFQVVLRTPEGPKVSFGGDVQDAYGQATTVLQAGKDTP